MIWRFLFLTEVLPGLPWGSEVKASARRPVFDPGSGRSPGEGNGNPLQYSCLENPMDGGDWWATVYGVAKSRTRLSDFTSLLPYRGWNVVFRISTSFEKVEVLCPF